MEDAISPVLAKGDTNKNRIKSFLVVILITERLFVENYYSLTLKFSE